MIRLTSLLFAAASLLVACGGDGTLSPYDDSATIRVYWLLDGKVWPAAREVDDRDDLSDAALEELLEGPTEREQRDLGLESEVASLDADLSEPGLAQVVYTLTQFADTESAEVGGRTYTRADFEEQTPAILVESPLPFEEVGNPVEASGTANTFEATFAYELTDTDGRIVDGGFVTATSGTGTRGTFELTTDAYEIPFDGVGALIVFERSAKDGSRVNLVETPVRMTR